MRSAIELSMQKMLEGFGGPFGAVIVRKGKVIAEGYNRVTSLNDPTAHAEVVAIREACKILDTYDLSGCEIYSSCEPCPMCLAAIYWARLERIYFGNSRQSAAAVGFDDAFLYEEVGRPINERKIPTIQILQHEAEAAFKAWDAMPGKILY